ncbi:uncharacterized protein LOC141712420 isoform X3 [Apium graveolens]|uniref:uncharacterized protein LOC141712420 isoform X3 n=1 Tax=Apium graveolens TaxID=4045 RepID=UPI003D7969D0
MESKNKKNKAPPISNSNPHPHSHLFQTLVSAAAAAPNGLKSSLLRKLYYVLVELSRSLWSCKEEGTGLVHFVYEIVPSGMRVTSEDLCRLSDILFKEFCKCFKQCNSDLSVSSDSKGDKQAISHPDMLASSAELSILLRCCLKIQDLLNQQGINDENGRRLFVILRTLSQLVSSGESSISLEDLCSSKICYGEDGSGSISAKEFVALICSLELTDSCIPVLSSIIEVFVDELSVSRKLGAYFSRIDSVYSTRHRLLVDYLGDCDLKIIWELICTHFLLFVSNERDIENLLSRLAWPHKEFLAPELSVNAALSLLDKPHMPCIPKLMQTHMISLVSEAIGFNLDCDHSKPDLKLVDHYLKIFRRSVVLYADHIAKLQIDGCPENSKFHFLKSNVSGQFFQAFESCVLPATREKINYLNTSFCGSWDSHCRDRFSRSKGDLSTSAINYMKENVCIIDRSCRDDLLSVVSSIITRASNDIDSVVFDAYDDASVQDVCFLTSLLKLISISLLQSLWCLWSRHKGFPESENLSSLAIMNLIVFEEGNLKALKSVDIGSRFPQKVARGHKSTSLVIAAKFLKMQSRNLSKIPPANVLMTIEDGQHSFSSNSGSLNAVATVGNNRNTAKTCDGVNYLRCIGVKSPDDDLADFIECKEGKDYSAWLKDRDKNRKRKYARQAVLIQKKKKNALKLAKAPNINDN